MTTVSKSRFISTFRPEYGQVGVTNARQDWLMGIAAALDKNDPAPDMIGLLASMDDRDRLMFGTSDEQLEARNLRKRGIRAHEVCRNYNISAAELRKWDRDGRLGHRFMLEAASGPTGGIPFWDPIIVGKAIKNIKAWRAEAEQKP